MPGKLESEKEKPNNLSRHTIGILKHIRDNFTHEEFVFVSKSLRQSEVTVENLMPVLQTSQWQPTECFILDMQRILDARIPDENTVIDLPKIESLFGRDKRVMELPIDWFMSLQPKLGKVSRESREKTTTWEAPMVKKKSTLKVADSRPVQKKASVLKVSSEE